ncbi:MAG: hypothetical protein AAFW73_14120 [Bacteroidota bacterium]
MKSNNLKHLVFAAVLLVALATLASCNRGVGCPNNFSIEEPIAPAQPR